MATNLNISENQERVPLTVGSRGVLRSITPDNGSPYYVGARAYVTQTAGGAIVTVIDKDGTTTATILNGADGQDGADGADGNGIVSIDLTSSVGNVDTYTITYDDGTTDTFNITNGVDGQDGADGADGADGYSPTATVTKSGDTATITITDINGTTTATVKDGTQANAFTAEFGTTTYADVKDAYDDDAILICTVLDGDNTMVLQLVYFDATNEIFFFAEPNGDGWYWTQLSNADGWDDGTRYLASTDVATQLADGLMSALDKQKLDGLSKRNIWYGTCSTSSSQSPKTITTASGDFSLTAGNMLVVLFSHTNSLSSVSLQVDGGASKSAYAMDGTSDISNRWGSDEVVSFVYDGTKFIMLEQGKASTTQYGITKLNNTVTSTSTSEAATANAVKNAYDNGGVQSVNGSTGAVTLSIPSNVSDLNNDSGFITSPDVVYCTCSTAAATAAKVATIVSGTLTTLTTGCQAIVKFTNANGKASPTLKVGDTDAKTIYRYGTTAPSTSAASSWNAGSCIWFVYDGKYWQMAGWINTTYSEASVAEITSSSSSTARLISGRRAKAAVEAFAPVKDVTVDGTSVLSGTTAAIDLSGKADASHTHTTSDITDFPSLAAVATSGDYDDLTDKPAIHNVPSGGSSGQVLSKASGTDYDLAWVNQSGGGGGTITDVTVDGTSVVTGTTAAIDLTGKSDVGHTHTKSAITDFPTLAAVATTGNYNSLTDKPTIPTITDTYSGTSSNGMSGKAVKSAIDALDGTVSGTAGSGKTLTAFSQTDGKVSATFGNISITKSQVSDFPTIPSKTSELTNDSNFVSPIDLSDNLLSTLYYLNVSGSTASLVNASFVPISIASAAAAFRSVSGVQIAQVLNVSGSNFKLRMYDIVDADTINGTVRLVAVDNDTIYVADLADAGSGLVGTISTVSIPTDTGDLTNGAGFLDASGILNLFYPVGSYYETSDTSFDPNISWGGTWSLETEGQVHISAGANYITGTTGGATTSATGDHTLTETEIPAHTHGSKTVSYEFTSRRQGANYQSIWGVSNVTVSQSSGTATSNAVGSTNQRSDVVSLSASHTHDSVGGGDSHNHGSVSTMQPYIVVNRWHRTA